MQYMYKKTTKHKHKQQIEIENGNNKKDKTQIKSSAAFYKYMSTVMKGYKKVADLFFFWFILYLFVRDGKPKREKEKKKKIIIYTVLRSSTALFIIRV